MLYLDNYSVVSEQDSHGYPKSGSGMLEVILLGQFEVLQDGERRTIPSRNAQSLFAYLLLNAGQAHRREQLAGLFWPDSTEDNARSYLRHELWRLRKILERAGQSYFLVDNLTIAFDPQGEFSLDVLTLERGALEANTADGLAAALSVYRGELLPGFYEGWVTLERERLQHLFEAGIARLLELLRAEDRWMEVQDWASRWIAFGQWPEPAYQALMYAYANAGDISRVVSTYKRLGHGMVSELGIEPSEQTRALFESLQAGWKTGAMAPTAAPTTQGPIASADQAPAGPAVPRLRHLNLPRPLTSFIGREQEIEQVVGLLSSSRLVTITGAGGVGKTRLAIQVAGALAPNYRHGVCWVDLATLTPSNLPGTQSGTEQRNRGQGTAGLSLKTERGRRLGEDAVAEVTAKALWLPESPGAHLLDVLQEHLGNMQLLFVLDNCEHVVTACAALVERLLGECPQLKVLATSREPLGVAGEKAWILPSLSLPTSGPSIELSTIAQSEAVRLFIERAADVLPNYKPAETDAPALAQICLRLDGIPLAVELAAARIKLLSASEIAARLDSRFGLLTAGRRTALPRHQTLRAAIEWSYDLLSRPEQILFRRLSVFAESFTLQAAEAVCIGDGLECDETLALLGLLVYKSLLHVVPTPQESGLATRYRFLETICSYGRLKLAEAGETQSMRDRHAAYFVSLVESAEPRLMLQDQARWYDLLQEERENIRAAIEWYAESDQAEGALRLVGAMLWFWWWRHGLVREGLDPVIKALALPSGSHFELRRARALNTAGYLHWVLGDVIAAKSNIKEALAIFRETGDEAGLAWSLQLLGMTLTAEGQYDLADEVMNEGVAIARKLGDLGKGSFALAFRGDIAMRQGDHSRAERIYEESAEVLGEVGNKLFQGYPLRRLGYLSLEHGDVGRAWSTFRKSLAINQEGSDKLGLAACLTSMSALALRLDKPLLAATLLGAVESRLKSLRILLLHEDRLELAGVHSESAARLDEATFEAAYAQGWVLDDDEVIGLVDLVLGAELSEQSTIPRRAQQRSDAQRPGD